MDASASQLRTRMLNREVTVSAERPTNGTDVLAGTGPGRAEPGRTEPGDSVVVRAVPSSARFGVQVGSAEGDEFSPQVGVLRRAESSAGPGQDWMGVRVPLVSKADDLLHLKAQAAKRFLSMSHWGASEYSTALHWVECESFDAFSIRPAPWQGEFKQLPVIGGASPTHRPRDDRPAHRSTDRGRNVHRYECRHRSADGARRL